MAKKSKYLDELNQIMAENNGLLRPEDVVKFAKNPKTALHEAFTWDDDKAAHSWRLHQARQLIRVAVMVMPGTEDTKYRTYVSLKEDRYNDRGYRSVVEVLTDGNLRQAMLAEAMMEMQGFMAKYETLKELAEVFAAMKKAIKKPKAKRKYRRETSKAA